MLLERFEPTAEQKELGSLKVELDVQSLKNFVFETNINCNTSTPWPDQTNSSTTLEICQTILGTPIFVDICKDDVCDQ